MFRRRMSRSSSRRSFTRGAMKSHPRNDSSVSPYISRTGTRL